MIGAGLASKWLFAYFMFVTGPETDPGAPHACPSPACSAYAIVDRDECRKLLIAAKSKGDEVQLVAVCVEIGSGATHVDRALSPREKVELDLAREAKKSGSGT